MIIESRFKSLIGKTYFSNCGSNSLTNLKFIINNKKIKYNTQLTLNMKA